MEWEAWLTLGVVAAVVVLMATTRRSPDVLMIAGVTVLLVAGVLTPGEALRGMANEGMITVAALFVVAAGVQRAGGFAMIVDRVMGRPKTLSSALRRVTTPPAVLSAFMNNTPLVAMMVPAMRAWARKNRLSVSRLLLPMNYAVILGGLCTLIGTSTNVVVSGMLEAKRGTGMAMFDMAWLGVPALAVGTVYLLLASGRLLPERKPVVSPQDDPRSYTAEMRVEAGSPLAGKGIEEAGLRHLPGVFLMEIERAGTILPAVGPEERLRAGDRLVFVGVVESVVDLQKIPGLSPATDQIFKLDSPRSQRCLIEAVVSNSCPIVGKTIRDGRFRSIYNAVVVAVARNGERLKGKIGDIVLRAGDMLLLEGLPTFADAQRNSRDFYLVSEVEDSAPPRHHKRWLALVILAAMVAAAATGALSMLQAAFVACGLLFATRCLTVTEARRAIEWEVLLLIAASFGLAAAMEKTGAAETLAGSLIGLGGSSPWVCLALVYAVTMIFTEMMSNNAAAMLVFPIAWATAARLGVNPQPFVMSIAVAASCGFATPIGYQTNIMVYGPGGYRFRDYLALGGPLNLIVMAVTIAVAPRVWPF